MRKQIVDLQLGETMVHLRVTDSGRYIWNTERHSNADYELHLILSGACSVEVGNDTYALLPGHAILIAPGQYHKPKVTAPAFQRLSIPFVLSKGRLAQSIEQAITPCKVVQLPHPILSLAQQIFDECHSEELFHPEMLRSLLGHLMVSVVRQLNLSTAASSQFSSSNCYTDIIDDYFEHHLADYGNETLLAQQLHVSQRQLSRILHTHYGMTFRQKLLQTRMEHAAWLLRTSKRTVNQIGLDVGYSSESTFYQNFKAYHGKTPQQYRNTSSCKAGEPFEEAKATDKSV